jgi:hypothetical protein
MHPRAVLVILTLATFSPAPFVARAEGPTQPLSRAAKAKELNARKAFGAGDWARALELYSDLYAETLHPVYLRNIGRCHQRLRNPQKAIDLFQEYLAKGKPAADERTEIEGYIKEMEQLKQEQEAAARPAPAPATAATPTSPAPAPVVLHPPVIQAAPQEQLGLTATHEPAPVYKRWWFWTAIGAAVAGGVVTAVALSRDSSPMMVCPPGVSQCK